jgi:beta-alanine degradation protein BauB
MTDLEEKTNDAVTIAPHLHTVIFENDKIRVLKIQVKPGDKARMHWHPENINYILSSGKLRFTKLDNSVVEVDLKEGQVTSSNAGSHAVENVGDSTVQTIQVELKEK